MTKSIVYTFMLILTSQLAQSQTRRTENSAAGRTYSSMTNRGTVQPFLNIADLQMRSLDFEEAFLTIENALAQNPQSAELLMLRARVNALLGFGNEAQSDIQKATKINPYIAKIYGNFTNGGLEQILSIEPKKALLKLSTYKKMGYYYSYLDNIMMETKDNPSTSEQLDAILAQIENDELEKALILIDAAIDTEKPSYLLMDLKGIALKESGDYAQADLFAREALVINPDFAIGLFNYADLLYKSNILDQALLHLNEAIEIDPKLTKAYFSRAMIYKRLGFLEKALDDYNTIIDIRGEDYMEAYVNRGLTKKMLADMGGALADLNFVIQSYPNNPELRKNRGNLHMLLGFPRKAIDDYTAALTFDSNYAEVYFNRALAHFQIFDKISGCFDLEASVKNGYENAQDVLDSMCNHE